MKYNGMGRDRGEMLFRLFSSFSFLLFLYSFLKGLSHASVSDRTDGLHQTWDGGLITTVRFSLPPAP
jgi:hypothetical protein